MDYTVYVFPTGLVMTIETGSGVYVQEYTGNREVISKILKAQTKARTGKNWVRSVNFVFLTEDSEAFYKVNIPEKIMKVITGLVVEGSYETKVNNLMQAISKIPTDVFAKLPDEFVNSITELRKLFKPQEDTPF